MSQRRKAGAGLWRDAKGTYHVDISVRGTSRIRVSTGTGERRHAEEYRDRLKTDLWRQTRLGEPPPMTWTAAAAEWRADAARRGLATLADAKTRLAWIEQRLGNRMIADIGEEDLRATLAAKHAEKKVSGAVSGATCNRYYAAMSAVLNFAARRHWITAVPRLTRRELYPETNDRFRWLAAEEATRLFAELPPHLARMARFALATGLRQANVTGLRWADVDLERRTAWAWPHETKNRKRYSIPLNADALAVLAECQGMHDERVFVYANHTHKKPKPAVPIAQPTGPAWYKAVERAGLKGLRWHDLRHTWASWHVMAGTRLEVLQQLGGWSDFKMVLRYAHLSTSYVAAFAGNSEIRVKISSRVNVSGSDVIQFPMQKQGVADGTRTHNTRNHNPGETSE